MNNREIYSKDPASRKLENEGVANVNDEKTNKALSVLRYELDTFVCDGQYEKGLEHILDTYLKNIDQAQQPGVWVSGFYGSGKSHLVKMLRALWMDTEFSDGATGRGVAGLPQNIRDLLKELSVRGKRHGGLHAASGTLGAGAGGSVRPALLRIVFKSVDLPGKYHLARFVMWMKKEDIYNDVRSLVEKNGINWQDELDYFYVAEKLHDALVQVKPNLFSSNATCAETLRDMFPNVKDVSNDDMVRAIRQALTREGKFPLTLIALDEVQQFIGENIERSNDVQEVVETCCKYIGGKLLFVGTGQTAVTGTSNLKKLEGRFTVRVELSDTDVDTVIRKVILAKKADALKPVDEVIQTNIGEVSRHLADTTIGHRQDDMDYFARDYPILPVRRRFWENTLRVLDQTGTESQLRNQLSMVHKVIQTNLDEPLGHVVPADYLYFDSADKLLQARILPRKLHEKTMNWMNGTEEERLIARACGIVFLVNKLAGSNQEIGIKATVDTIADLLVEDLSMGSGNLRGQLSALLDKCELLMRVGDEFRIQTEESTAWNDEFRGQQSQLANEAHRIEAERDDRIRGKFNKLVGTLSIPHGKSKVARALNTVFSAELPQDRDKKVYVWVRDGWSTDENSVRGDALQAGNLSPVVFVFIPRRSGIGLRHNLIEYKAATTTLGIRGVPNSPEGTEARAYMETVKQTAESKINELLDEAFSGARVFQGGGNEIQGAGLQEMVREAAGNAVMRLYPKFNTADHTGWDKVYAKARQGAPDALKAVGHDGEPGGQPVCKSILGVIGAGKKGAEIRGVFEAPPYGWSRDAVDGGLQVLLTARLILARDERSRSVDPKELDRKQMGKAFFKVESATVTAQQRIAVRKLMQKLGNTAKSGEELEVIPSFLQNMQQLADGAGGDAPKPQRPDTSALDDIRKTAGNGQIIALANGFDEFSRCIDEWTDLEKRIKRCRPLWESLMILLRYAGDMKTAEEVRRQVRIIENQRLLLAEPDPVQPLLKSLEDDLRKELNAKVQRYSDALEVQRKLLESEAFWRKLTKDERDDIYGQCDITEVPPIDVGTRDELVGVLEQYPIRMWHDRTDAMAGRFARARELAAKVMEPETQTVDIPRRTITSEDDIRVWLAEVEQQLKSALEKGPVVIQ